MNVWTKECSFNKSVVAIKDCPWVGGLVKSFVIQGYVKPVLGYFTLFLFNTFNFMFGVYHYLFRSI